MKDQLHTLSDENVLLKEKCQHISSQLDIALLQVLELSNETDICR